MHCDDCVGIILHDVKGVMDNCVLCCRAKKSQTCRFRGLKDVKLLICKKCATDRCFVCLKEYKFLVLSDKNEMIFCSNDEIKQGDLRCKNQRFLTKTATTFEPILN